MAKLPPDFVERMHHMLGNEADMFLKSFEAPRTQALRFNLMKKRAEAPSMKELFRRFLLQPVPWCETGYYYDEQARPGKHPYHAAGLYYIQEPSAMSAVELLNPEPGDVVLDLAAAPGGKSTHIADKLQGEGLLIANEIHPSRAKILSENIERMGISNCVVTNAPPDRLAARFPAFFDKIMLDAPCSGEGMFRKDPDAVSEWSVDHVRMCAARQMDILPDAVSMLKPGGVLAYSTCTFNREENEDTIQALIKRFPELELQQTERIWPHLQKGEGHFVAILRKTAAHSEEAVFHPAPNGRLANGKLKKSGQSPKKPNKIVSDAVTLFEYFVKENLTGFTLGSGEPLLFGEQLYWLPHAAGSSFDGHDLGGLKVLRPGLHLGELKKNRFEPSHALALAIRTDTVQASLTYSAAPESMEMKAYLRGESLFTERSEQGWVLVMAADYPIGWGKESGGQLKNRYPKGLRWPF